MDAEERIKQNITHSFTIKGLLEEKNAADIVGIKVGKITSITDIFLIATVKNSLMQEAAAQVVLEYAKDAGLKTHKTLTRSQEGADWRVLDLGDIIVHLMTSEARNFYDLEKLWHKGEVFITDRKEEEKKKEAKIKEKE